MWDLLGSCHAQVVFLGRVVTGTVVSCGCECGMRGAVGVVWTPDKDAPWLTAIGGVSMHGQLGGGPGGQTRTRWRDYVFWLVWEEVVGDRHLSGNLFFSCTKNDPELD